MTVKFGLPISYAAALAIQNKCAAGVNAKGGKR